MQEFHILRRILYTVHAFFPHSNDFPHMRKKYTEKGCLYVSNVTRFERFYNSITGKHVPCEDMDKSELTSSLIGYMFSRTQSLFKWEGLPETIPQRNLELYLQVNGACAISPYNDKLYAFVGGFGGEPNVYYMPTIYTIANPALKYSANLVIDEDCTVIYNDALHQGLYPLHLRYAKNMVETEISLKLANINSRIISLISASDDRTKASADKFIQDITDGKLSVIGESKFFDDLKTSPYSASSHGIITDLIELLQYFKASWYNEIGLNANYNMKRESINSGESQLNNDALLPLIDDMLECRRRACEKINQMYDLSVSVKYNSAWEDNEKEIEAEQNNLENDRGENDGISESE